jgi:hypothetical protein
MKKKHPKLEARKGRAGAKPTDVVLIFKMMVIQWLHNLSDG